MLMNIDDIFTEINDCRPRWLWHFNSELCLLDLSWQVIFDWSLHEQEHHKVIKLEMKSAYDAWREKGMVTRRLLDRLWEFGFQEPHLKAFLLRLGAGFQHLVHVGEFVDSGFQQFFWR